MRFGAHVPTRGRLSRGVDYAVSVGAETIQLFVSNPRGWAPPNVDPDAAAELRERRAAAGIGPMFVHSSYLINIASPDDAFLHRSAVLARRELEAAAEIGADGLIVHAGAGGAGTGGSSLERAAASVLAVVGDDDGPQVVLELTAGGGGSVAATIPQAAALLAAIGDHPRVGLCLDTCHLFAAGYPLDDPRSASRPFDELRSAGLAERLRVIHANDARDPRGSRRDRHAHVGDGCLGEEGFAAILSDPLVRELPVLIETPGHEEEDRRNLATLRRLATVV
jgi:deoxyribonuclease-4